METKVAAVSMRGVTKTFGAVVANEDVDLDIYKGEILALLGENSSTCVGLRYGHALHNSSFSRHMAHTLHYFISLHITSSDYTTDLPIVHLPRLYRSFHSRPVLSTCVPTVLIMRGTGI